MSTKQDVFTRGAFTRFVEDVEPGLLRALISSAGSDVGREATADALVYAWRHWERVRDMENPAGYLYRVGRSNVRRYRQRPVILPPEIATSDPWVEPNLGEALERLTERQRTVEWDAFFWTPRDRWSRLQPDDRERRRRRPCRRNPPGTRIGETHLSEAI